jgi:hypothetical protein
MLLKEASIILCSFEGVTFLLCKKAKEYSYGKLIGCEAGKKHTSSISWWQ